MGQTWEPLFWLIVLLPLPIPIPVCLPIIGIGILLLGLVIVGTGLTGLKGEITAPITRKLYYPRKHKSKSRLIKGIMVFVLIITFIGGLYYHRNFVISSFSETLEALPVVSAPTSTPTLAPVISVEEAEKEAFRLINQAREQEGLHPTKWDEELYKLSKAHTQEMANSGKLFHTPMGASYAENCWGARVTINTACKNSRGL